MLVLSRQRDETIMIGESIEITVVDVRGDKVRLGITAPTRIAVHRKEVYDAIRSENEDAARLETEEIEAIAGRVRPGRGRDARDDAAAGSASRPVDGAATRVRARPSPAETRTRPRLVGGGGSGEETRAPEADGDAASDGGPARPEAAAG